MNQRRHELSAEELEAEGASELPNREALSLVSGNVDGPVNSVVASNVLSDNTTTVVESEQVEVIQQRT